jgi:RNA polymerase sigma factor (sigma-70 family)
MLLNRDPLGDPEPLIRKIYAYAAYRLGDGPDAEDVTSETFERALRYRDSYDPSKGTPIQWLIGIARRRIDWSLLARAPVPPGAAERSSDEDLAGEAIERVALAAALAELPERDRELIALRYGADLSARQIAQLLGLRTNAVEVALHRALAKLRATLETPRDDSRHVRAPNEAMGL